MRKLKAFWDLMRLDHGVMLFIAVLVGALIVQRGIPPGDKLFFAFLTPFFLGASTFALNDYFDYKVDMRNERMDRPLVRGDIKPKTALHIFFILFPLGIMSAWFVNITCFLIAVFTGFLSILYDIWMKKVKLLGNFYIAYIMAIPFVFGGTIVDTKIFPIIFVLALIAFLTGVGREIMKDVMDYKGDRAEGVKSFPHYIGEEKSMITASIFYIIAVVISLLPFLFKIGEIGELYHNNLHYLAIVMITNAMLIYTSTDLIALRSKSMGFHRRLTLTAIFIGLIAFLIGAFTG